MKLRVMWMTRKSRVLSFFLSFFSLYWDFVGESVRLKEHREIEVAQTLMFYLLKWLCICPSQLSQ